MPNFDTFGLPTALISSIGAIEIDAVLSENHRFESLVTENPVEDGSVLSDHIVNLPFVLEIEGRFTDTPFGFLQSVVTGALTGIAASLEVPTLITALTAAGIAAQLGESRAGLSKTKFQLLVALQVIREPLQVVTGLNTYNNMVIQQVTAARGVSDGKSIRFNATLREVKIIGENVKSNRALVVEELQSRFVNPRHLGIVQVASFVSAGIVEGGI